MAEQCHTAEVSRAGFYRYLHQAKPKQADMLLRARLQELAVAHHRLRGYRMLTALLRREGQLVNRKRVLRLMREDNLLSLRRRKYVFTTDSAHTLPIYPNLARHAKLTAPNQLWVSDITFIRLRDEFIYLAVILDAYSRRVVGWDLGRTLHAELALGALRMALKQRSWKAEGLIHHSDRGVQYASAEYTALLDNNEIQISMSRRGNPYDNARAERFMRTLKEEEVHGAAYLNLEDARKRIGRFIEEVYNRKRLHSALRYLTPEEFEQHSQARGSDGADGSGNLLPVAFGSVGIADIDAGAVVDIDIGNHQRQPPRESLAMASRVLENASTSKPSISRNVTMVVRTDGSSSTSSIFRFCVMRRFNTSVNLDPLPGSDST